MAKVRKAQPKNIRFLPTADRPKVKNTWSKKAIRTSGIIDARERFLEARRAQNFAMNIVLSLRAAPHSAIEQAKQELSDIFSRLMREIDQSAS